MIIWLTGQPGSGKSTLARALKERGVVDYIVDGDEVRALHEEGYDYYGRHRNVERAQFVALWLDSMGLNVAVAVIAPHRKQRLAFRAKVEDYREVYLFGREHEDRSRLVDDYETPTRTEALHLKTGDWEADVGVDWCVNRILEHVE